MTAKHRGGEDHGGHVPEHRPAEWLVLAYLAGDNDLEGALLRDLGEMERVGSRPGRVEVLVQVDRARGFDASHGDWRTTRRYHVRRGADPRRLASRLLADLGETNTGDPRVLEDFIRFGARRYPARACALILSNHGSGFYVPPEFRAVPPELRANPWLAPARGAVRPPRPRRRALFGPGRRHQAAGALLPRGIAYDEDAADCLDNRELKRVLRRAHRVLGRKVDLLGMDACLMTMLEVAYQVREHARVLVGSEELEPNDGWPYEAILRDLTGRPAMTAAELAETIVRRYVEHYERTGEEATLAAIDLRRLEPVVAAVDALAGALLAGLGRPGGRAEVQAARRSSLEFFNGAYVDLRDLARNLASVSEGEAVRAACAALQRALERRGPGGAILAAGAVGARLRRACGLSIYFPPFRDPSALYAELDFARRTRWAGFLEAYLAAARAGALR
jgi:hypothetical protein